MASSRLEKIGNIFTRIQGLLKSGAMKPNDVPIFYEIYKAFPPLKERKYFEEAPEIRVRPIFYAEDKERANITENTLFNMYEHQQASPTFTPRTQAQTKPRDTEKSAPKETVSFDWKELDLKQ